MNIAGLDLSLTSTGWAKRKHAVGALPAEFTAGRVPSKGQKTDSLKQRVIRLDKIYEKLDAFLRDVDRLIIEAPTPGSMGHQHDRSGLWWRVVSFAESDGIHVTEVSPTTLKMYVTGNGGANKDDVLTDAIRTYPMVPFRGNDEADATGLLAMGVRHYLPKHALEASRTLKQLSAMDKVRWAS